MYTLNDQIDIDGDWWDSARPEAKTAGRLTFTRSKGIELHVNQAFSPIAGDVRPGDPNPTYECIHGRTVKGEAVTLIDAQQLGASLNFGSAGLMQPGKIHARILVIGAHLPTNFRFSNMICRIPNLQVWMGKQVIMQHMTCDSESRILRQNYSIARMDSEELHVQAISSKISMQYGWESSLDAYSLIHVKTHASFQIIPSSQQPVDWFIEQFNKLETLISVLSGEVFLSDSIQSKVNKSGHLVSVLFAGDADELCHRKYPGDFFLSGLSISTPFWECCDKWFEIFPKIGTTVTLAMSVMGSKELWIHTRFLSLIQALEGFHRALYEGAYMEDSAYDAVRKDIQDAIPKNVSDSHRSALASRIRYGNEYSLRKRLGELEKCLTDEIRFHLFGPAKSIPDTWVNTRNYYTHWDEELRDSILNVQEMHYANVRIANFLNTLFRLRIGVPPSDIEAAFRGTSSVAQHLIELNIIERRAVDPTFVPHAIMTISSRSDDAGADPLPFTDEGEQTGS